MDKVGYCCTYVPVELIQAAGFLPKRIVPPRGEKDEVALDPNLCPYLKAVYRRLSEEGLRGIVLINCCDGMRRLYDAVRHFLGLEAFLMDVPRRITPAAIEYFRESLGELASWLGRLAGRGISPRDLMQTIRDCNASRAAFFRKLRERPRMGDVLRVLKGGFPPPQGELAGLRPREEEGRVRILVTGSMLEADGLLDLIEERGGEVVLDVCSGPRAPEEVPERGDPLDALADAYLRKPPCARVEGRRRWSFLEGTIAQVDGVISYTPKFCDPYLYEVSRLQEVCHSLSKPFLHLEGEYTAAVGENMRIRLQAFLERWA